jgi:hypothetical protein
MIFKIIVTIFLVIFSQYIITPIFYAFHPVYYPILVNAAFGSVIIFVLDNFGFWLFIALVVWIWKGLISQETQNSNYNNYGGN